MKTERIIAKISVGEVEFNPDFISRYGETCLRFGIVNIGFVCSFRVENQFQEWISGVAFPGLMKTSRPGSVSVMVGMLVLDKGQMAESRLNSLWKHQENSIRAFVAERFKAHLESMLDRGEMQGQETFAPSKNVDYGDPELYKNLEFLDF